MKSKIIFILILAALSYSACDKIEAPYREEVVAPDFCATGIDDSIPSRKVLVEDYTGHACGNCPDANIFLNDTLKEIYDHCLVVVSVHAGFFAGTCPTAIACPHANPPLPSTAYATDFNTAPGTAWNTFFGIQGNPKGMVNRTGYPNTHSKDVPAWADAVASQLALPADAKIELTNDYSSSTNSVNVSVQSEFFSNLTGEYILQVVITEDSLVDWQQWYNHTPQHVDNYVHHHVLRDVLNSTWGESLFTTGVSAGDVITKNYSYTISNLWDVDQCSIVAFIYNADTYEVIQSEELKVKE